MNNKTSGKGSSIPMKFLYNNRISPVAGREYVYQLEPLHLGDLEQCVRKYANGLINSKGGIMLFGVDKKGYVNGCRISRDLEDRYRLAIDRSIGSFVPFVAPESYRITFHDVIPRDRNLKVIEIKVSPAQLGHIHEDGLEQVYLVNEGDLLGPLYPQEIKDLVIARYKESLEVMASTKDFITPGIKRTKAREDKKCDVIVLD